MANKFGMSGVLLNLWLFLFITQMEDPTRLASRNVFFFGTPNDNNWYVFLQKVEQNKKQNLMIYIDQISSSINRLRSLTLIRFFQGKCLFL